MFDIKVESPAIMGNAPLMGMALAIKAQQLIMEANMKRYFPIQYRMMKTMQAAMEKGR